MKGKYYTFIVRIHSESAGKFRGSVHHIRTQEEAHFNNFEGLKAFMDKHLSLADSMASEEKGPAIKK